MKSWGQICLTDMQLREAKLGQVISAASDFLLSICFICMGYGGQGQMVSYSYQCDALIKECL